jgi:diaminopimelate epimerase
VDGPAPSAAGVVRPHLIGLPIYKMTGSGNDFVMVGGRVSTPDDWTASDIQAACARGTGVGADGLVFVTPGSHPGAVRMIYFNSDGSRAAMCGNAALCSTTLAAHLNLAPADGMDLETDAGTYRSRAVGPGRSELNLAPVEAPQAVPGLGLAPGEQRAALGRVGVPHLVVLLDDVEQLDLMGRGRALRLDPTLAPEGANVNFISPGRNDREWLMRTYERGVEAETLACGTGSVAAGCAIQEWGLGRLPINIVTRSGRLLEIKATKAAGGGYEDVWLAGEGRMVFRGVLT